MGKVVNVEAAAVGRVPCKDDLAATDNVVRFVQTDHLADGVYHAKNTMKGQETERNQIHLMMHFIKEILAHNEGKKNVQGGGARNHLLLQQ